MYPFKYVFAVSYNQQKSSNLNMSQSFINKSVIPEVISVNPLWVLAVGSG